MDLLGTLSRLRHLAWQWYLAISYLFLLAGGIFVFYMVVHNQEQNEHSACLRGNESRQLIAEGFTKQRDYFASLGNPDNPRTKEFVRFMTQEIIEPIGEQRRCG